MWDLIVSVPDHCLSFYSVMLQSIRLIRFLLVGHCFFDFLTLFNVIETSVRVSQYIING